MAQSVRWWKNGDHPNDESEPVKVKRHGQEILDLSEGKVVKRYKGSEDENALCGQCSAPFGIHGWVGGPKTGEIVHPGDYVVGSEAPYKVEREDILGEQARAMEARDEELRKARESASEDGESGE